MIQLIRSTAPHDPKVALNDLTSLHKQYGSKPFIHELAQFILYPTISFMQRSKLLPLFNLVVLLLMCLNLANLAYMRVIKFLRFIG